MSGQTKGRQEKAQKAVEKAHANLLSIAAGKSTSAVAAFALFDATAVIFQDEGGVRPTIAKEKAPKEGTFMQPSHSNSNLSMRPVSEHQQRFAVSEENVGESGFWLCIPRAAAEDMACDGTESWEFNTTVGGKNLSEVVFRGFTADSVVVGIAIPLAELSILEGHAAKTRTLK